MEEKLIDNEASDQMKLHAMFKPDGDLSLSDIIDADTIQSLMENLSHMTGMCCGIADLKGNILASVGWRDICENFHRINPESKKNCIESDIKLSAGVKPGEFKLYKCKNNMWEAASPITISGQHMGNIFLGQFFCADEKVDIEIFRKQARLFGFDEEKYIKAIERVPRYDRKAVEHAIRFFAEFAILISTQSYNNLVLSRSLTEQKEAEEELVIAKERAEENEKRLKAIEKVAHIGTYEIDLITGNAIWSDETFKIFELDPKSDKEPTQAEYAKYLHKDDVEKLLTMFDNCLESGENFDLIYRIITLNNKIRHVHSIGEVRTDKNGKPITMVGTFQDITELMETKEKAKESEEKYRLLHENAGLGIGYYTPDGIVLSYNSVASRNMNGKPEDFEGQSIFDLFPKEAAEEYYSRIQNTLKSEEIMEYEDFVELPNQKFWFLSTYTKIVNSKNQALGVQIISQDITDIKKAEESLKESEFALQEAQRIALIGSWEMDTKTKKLVWSKQMYELLEVDKSQEPTFELYFSRVHPDDLALVQELGDKVFNDNKAIQLDYRLRTPSGKVKYVSTEGQQVLDKNNKVIKLSGIVQDITERKKAEEEIQYQASLIEQVDSAIITINFENKILSWNDHAEKLYQWKKDEVLGKDIIELLGAEELKDETLRNFADLNKDGHWEGDYSVKRKDGSSIPAHIVNTYLKDKDGKSIGFIGVSTDITERKRAENELKQRMKELQIFNEASVDREILINNHRKEINELLMKSGKEKKYKTIE